MTVIGLVALTIGLAFIAGLTAGLWLNLLMWVPLLFLSQIRDEAQAYRVVTLLTMAVAATAVFLFGTLVIGMPWFAAAVSGALVGITSYAQPVAQRPVTLAEYTGVAPPSLRGLDLSGADLTSANLIGEDLTGTNLSDADLTGADLTGADLTGATLTRANFTSAILLDATLASEDLTGASTGVPDIEYNGAILNGATMPDGSIHE